MFRKKSTRDLVHAGEDAAVDPGARSEKKKKQSPGNGVPINIGALIRTKAFLGGVCIFLGLTISLGAVPVLKAKVADVIPVYTFAHSVSRGTQLTADMLTETAMANYNLPAGVVADQEDVLEGYLTADVIVGDILTAGRVSPQYPGDDPQLTQLPSGKLAISVSLSAMSQSLSSKLRGGDLIQIFAVRKEDSDSAIAYASAPGELQCVEVLSVSDSMGIEVSAQGANQIGTVTLIADSVQAAALVALEHSATIHAALVVRGDDTRKAQLLQEQQDVLEQLRIDREPTPPAEEDTMLEGGV